MIIQGKSKLEINKIYNLEILAPDKKYYLQGFKVIKEVTKKEYLEFCKECNVLNQVISGNDGPYYYEVQTD